MHPVQLKNSSQKCTEMHYEHTKSLKLILIKFQATFLSETPFRIETHQTGSKFSRRGQMVS